MAALVIPDPRDVLRSKIADVLAHVSVFATAALGESDAELEKAIDKTIDALWAVQEYRHRVRGTWQPAPQGSRPTLQEMHERRLLPVLVEDARDNG